ncbi:MAG: FG-GAP repeat protein [Deltaproteobacteria bacterium]|nr:FG-GAP repeat protein [Deltaproteobacteria bacterium]
MKAQAINILATVAITVLMAFGGCSSDENNNPTDLGPGSDITPPEAVTGFAARDEDNAVDLSWVNPVDEDLAGVVVLRRNDGLFPTSVEDVSATQVADTLLGSMTDSPLNAGVTYHYAAFARDEASNYSPAAQATATPFAPFTRERTILRASDAQAYDFFGYSVAQSSSFAIVGAPYEDGGEGDPLPDAGAAYVFERNLATDSWAEVQKLTATDSQGFDVFGSVVSLSGNYAIVGAFMEAGGEGDPTPEAGAAYIFERDAETGIWNQTAILRASDAQAGDLFGRSVSISGSRIVVGAHFEDGGVGSPAPNSGAAYVFERNPETGDWNQTAILRASDAQTGDNFGKSVAISGDYAIVGAYFENGGTDDPASDSGSAYVFRRDAATGVWSQDAILRASDFQDNDYFGCSVSISGNLAIVGAYKEDGGTYNLRPDSGAAYVFEKDPGTGAWSQAAILRSSDAQDTDYFGASVEIRNDHAVVGAFYEDGGTGNPVVNSGAAYVFRRNAGTGAWSQTSIIRASDGQLDDQFSGAVSISDDLAIVGAKLEDGGTDNQLWESGAVYIID